ncbi:SMP-30/gluconolactonase/LRE family protein, partial [Candidatus Bipolaricaulota bacterium]|nr:SMP-30/gluconolactonase/LRE family protein [Candidatus Bipolaricaulota bacterium]
GRLYMYDTRLDRQELVYEGENIGGFTIQRDGALLLFGEEGRVKQLEDGKVETVVGGIQGENGTRFNDVIADPLGGVFCGTMPTDERPGRLYRLNSAGAVELILDGVELPNGMGFSPDRSTFYFTDTRSKRIYAFDYNGVTADISNQRTFAYVPESSGHPDGLTVDSEGCVWSARWNGSCIVRHNPKGGVVGKIDVPARKVTSASFGGENYNELYISTAGGGDRPSEGELAGSLFKITFEDVTGRPELTSSVMSAN